MTIPEPVAPTILAAFCRRHHIRRLSLFGSVTRSDWSAGSDVDVLVEFEPGLTPGLDFFTMQAELSALLGHPVDLYTPAWLGPRIHSRVRDDLKVLYDAA